MDRKKECSGEGRKVKDKRIDTGMKVRGGGQEEDRWALFPPALLCVLQAPQVNWDSGRAGRA